MQELKKINSQTNNKYINLYTDISEALLLKNSRRLQYMAMAQRLFENIIASEIVDYNITGLAMVNLCEILLDELKVFEDKKILKEIEILAGKIINLAKAQNIHPLIVQSYLLESKLALLDGNTSKASDLITEARLIAERQRLATLIKKTSVAEENLNAKIELWSNFAEKGKHIRQKIEQLKIDDYLKELANLFKKGTTNAIK